MNLEIQEAIFNVQIRVLQFVRSLIPIPMLNNITNNILYYDIKFLCRDIKIVC